MKFNTFEQLVEYIGALGHNIEDLDIKIQTRTIIEQQEPDVFSCSVDSPECPCASAVNETVDLAICSLHDEPVMTFNKGEENILVVEDFECIPYTCGTSFILLNGRELKVNICEMDGVATTSLMVRNGDKKSITKFKLTKDKSKTNTFSP